MAGWLQCCFAPPPQPKQTASNGVSTPSEPATEKAAAPFVAPVAPVPSTVSEPKRSTPVPDIVSPGEAVTKACAFIQKLADDRIGSCTDAQRLQNALQLIISDCKAESASICIICDDTVYGLVGQEKPGKTFDLRIHKLKDSGLMAERVLIASTDSVLWDSSGGEPAPTEVIFTGLASVLSVKIRLNDKVVGVLCVGFKSEESNHSSPWFSYMAIVASALSGVVKETVYPKCLSLLTGLRGVSDLHELVRTFFEGLQVVLAQHVNTMPWYRLAFINTNNTAATLFDDLSQAKKATTKRPTLLEASPADDLSTNTIFQKVVDVKASLLKSVLEPGTSPQVIVEDVRRLLNKSGTANPDIYTTRVLKPPASVCVLPLKESGLVLGALYCLSPVQTNFAEVLSHLHECCSVLAPSVFQVLRSSLAMEYMTLQNAAYDPLSDSSATKLNTLERPSSIAEHEDNSISGSPDGSQRGNDLLKPLASALSKHRLSREQPRRCISLTNLNSTGSPKNGQKNGQEGQEQRQTPTQNSSSNSSNNNAGSFIGALVTGLTDKLNEKRIKSSIDMPWADTLAELRISGHIGEGGYARVYKGLYQGLVVAVKVVVDETPSDRTQLKHAHEIALLTSLSHPNVLQAYVCFTDVSVKAFLKSCFPKAPEIFNHKNYMYLENHEARSCHIEVVEFCDQGNLCQAVHTGAFLCTVVNNEAAAVTKTGGSTHVCMRWLLVTLLEVANALSYLHSMGVVHCDLKPANCLLKGSTSDRRGFNIKLSDFGLSRVEDDRNDSGFRGNSCGTAAYIAPEVLMMSKQVKNSVDAYAFGIMMWEMFTACKPYASLRVDKMAREVLMKGLRPAFPPTTPLMYRQLAQACWAADPLTRPTFDFILRQLNAMLVCVDNRVIEELVPCVIDARATMMVYERNNCLKPSPITSPPPPSGIQGF